MAEIKSRQLLKILGPGLLYAGAAVGVSHLVQSTRAGAAFGFDLLIILILANVIKYPFFEFGPRYAVATRQSLIEGYNHIGKWAVWIYALFTLFTMFIVQAAITVVTAGLISKIFGLNISITQLSIIILLSTMLILIVGRFQLLDKLIKLIILTLTISTVIAVVSAIDIPKTMLDEAMVNFSWTDLTHISFLIAFIGWMPAPIDLSVWHSQWSLAKAKSSGIQISMKQSLLDFRIGFIGTTILAAGFLTLGSLVMYGTGEQFSPSGTVFAGQLIQLYTKSIGEWAYIIIAMAALTTMFSTTLTCLDAYPRVLKPTTEILFGSLRKMKAGSIMTYTWMLILVMGTIIIIAYFLKNMHQMVDLATTISFVTAPVLAFLNYKVVTDKHMPVESRPGKWLRIYAWTGLFFLTTFTLLFIVWRFFA